MSIIDIITIIVILGGILVLSLLKMRICPIFNIFHIPCPGCGLTRSFKCLLKGDFIGSIKYNPLGILLSLLAIIYIIAIIFKKKSLVDKFLNKHKWIIFAIFLVLTIIVWIININNPLLY